MCRWTHIDHFHQQHIIGCCACMQPRLAVLWLEANHSIGYSPQSDQEGPLSDRGLWISLPENGYFSFSSFSVIVSACPSVKIIISNQPQIIYSENLDIRY